MILFLLWGCMAMWQAPACVDDDEDGAPATDNCLVDDKHLATDQEVDCDDGDADVHPDAVEICNEADDNCNHVIDEDCDDTGKSES